jgi:hypothetical protein
MMAPVSPTPVDGIGEDQGASAVADQALVCDQAATRLDPSGFDPSRVEVISLGHSTAACSKERWIEVFAAYSSRARHHAAVLAAHNWDVLLVGNRVFLSSWYGSGGYWLPPTFGIDNRDLPEVSTEEMAALYDASQHPKTRRFASAIEAAAADETARQGSAVGESAGPKGDAQTPSQPS